MKKYGVLICLFISAQLSAGTILDNTTRRWGINSHVMNIPLYFMPEKSIEPPTRTIRRKHYLQAYKSRPSRRARRASKKIRKRQPKKRKRVIEQA